MAYSNMRLSRVMKNSAECIFVTEYISRTKKKTKKTQKLCMAEMGN